MQHSLNFEAGRKGSRAFFLLPFRESEKIILLTLDPFQFIDSLVRFTFIASFFLQFSSGNFSFLFSAIFEPIWQPQKKQFDGGPRYIFAI